MATGRLLRDPFSMVRVQHIISVRIQGEHLPERFEAPPRQLHCRQHNSARMIAVQQGYGVCQGLASREMKSLVSVCAPSGSSEDLGRGGHSRAASRISTTHHIASIMINSPISQVHRPTLVGA